MDGPAFFREPQTLRLGVKPAVPLVTKLIGGDPPPAGIGSRAEMGRQIARLAKEFAVDRVADWQFGADRRVDLDRGAGDESGDVLS
jgi:hypothetical protein